MSQTDLNGLAASGDETRRAATEGSRVYVSKAAPYLQRGFESGALTAIVGGIGLRSGLKALRDGDRGQGLSWLTFTVVCLAGTIDLWRTRGGTSAIEESDVVDTGVDVEAVADEAGSVGEQSHAAGEAASEVVDTSPDVDDVKSRGDSQLNTERDSESITQRDIADTGIDSEDLAETTDAERRDDGTSIESEDVNRLGKAAFNKQNQKVPAPQRAFNQGFLAHSSEAFWGIRNSDDAVVVSQDYDAVEGREGVDYVASSEIGADVRELTIPDTILNHWDEVYGGGTAVTGGDDILFVTTDDLADERVLLVLPAEWADDVFGEAE